MVWVKYMKEVSKFKDRLKCYLKDNKRNNYFDPQLVDKQSKRSISRIQNLKLILIILAQ